MPRRDRGQACQAPRSRPSRREAFSARYSYKLLLITTMPVSRGLVCVARAYIISGVSFCFE
jgi:hypothetical protein